MHRRSLRQQVRPSHTCRLVQVSSLLTQSVVGVRHGRSNPIGLIWPNTLGEGVGSRLTLVHVVGSSSLGFQGPWSLFCLLSRGQLNGRTDTSVDLSFRITDGMMRYRITAEKTLNPFTRRPFQGFTLPRTLLAVGDVKKREQTL
ncbi:type VI secretion IcmF C-terminal domain-containing protein [Pseudomonas sp. B21-035]|uniref:type VI secretion IcmF C-terminal domain-containing protein n=1 Tax=Pseudomonas sp. B21-035 TaxID=2895484 RepID=UPI0038D46DAF